MTPDDRARASLALSCTRDGRIVQILRDDLGFARAGGLGARFADIVDSGSAEKAETLIASLAQRDCIVGWHLNVPVDGTARPLYFAGAAAEDSLLILAAPGPDSVADLFEDVISANAAAPHALRTLLREKRTGITASISRDNQLYEELSRLNNELINRERELARKTAALERLSAEKSRLVAIAAHDLRNPLTVIASYADLLTLDGAVQGEHLQYVEEISQSARFMMELVEEMLDSSRLEGGRIEVELTEVDLVAAARHSATINRIRADRKSIAIAFAAETEHAIIRADPVKLRQILNNLVVNAIKFSPDHTTVAIRVCPHGDRALFEVEDQGVGIPSGQLAAIFEPYKTLGRTGTAGEPSIGLGLAIVQQLAELHRAAVEVESEEGRGSLFRVAFPLVR
jgi:two-component system, OmpR family, sensor kinase